jgi:hypothetical protein
MRDLDRGKRMIEEMILDQLLDSFPLITGRTVTDDWEGQAEQVEGSPDFIIGLDGRPFGVELTGVRQADDAWNYFDAASRLAWQKHKSYSRRGLFRFPIALVLHSDEPPLFDIRQGLASMGQEEFEGVGFAEVWAVDFSDAYYTPGHPLRRADMYCFKPAQWFGFYRIGTGDRKPYG